MTHQGSKHAEGKSFKNETVSLYICAFFWYYLYICLSVSSRLLNCAAGWTVWGLNPRRDKSFLSPAKHSDRLLGPLSLLFSGYRDFFSGGQVAGASSWPITFSAEVKNERSYTSASPLCLHGAEGDRDPFLTLFFKYALVYQVASSSLPTKSVCISDHIRHLTRISLFL